MSLRIESNYQSRCKIPTDINEHLPTLRRYATGGLSVVEFGVRGLNSTWALLAAAPERLISVDLQHPSDVGGNLGELELEAKAAGIDFRFIQANDLEITLDHCDLLFIDTYHTARQLQAELELHHGKVKRFLLFHDTVTFGEVGEDGSDGIGIAIGHFLKTYDDQWQLLEHFNNNNGLTVLGRK